MSVRRVYLLLIMASLFWSGAFITGKFAVREFPPFGLTFFRFFLALPFVFLIMYRQQPSDWLPSRDEWRPFITLGIIGTFCYHAFFFACLQYTTAINASLIGAVNPIITALLAAIFLGDKIGMTRLAGFVLSFAGVFAVITNGDYQIISQLRINKGDLLMLAAICCWAVYSLLSRRAMQKYSLSPRKVTAYTFLVCTIVSLPFAISEQPLQYLPLVSVAGWGSVLYMTLFASVLGYLFHLIAVSKIGASRSAVFVNLVPVFTIGQAWYFLGEPVTIFKLISAGMVISGVYLAVQPPTEPGQRLK